MLARGAPSNGTSGMLRTAQPDGILRRAATATLAVPPERYVRGFGRRFEFRGPNWPRPDPSIGSRQGLFRQTLKLAQMKDSVV